jgi:hypothetical protein
MVAHGEQGLRGLVGHLGAAVEVRLPRFSGRRAAGGRPVGVAGEMRLSRSWQGMRQERGTQQNQRKANLFFLPLLQCLGEEERGTVSFKTTPFSSSFFFFFLIMKRRRFGENALFHLKVAPERAKFQISP